MKFDESMDERGLLSKLESMLYEGLSISEISRRLEDRGHEDHRLILTGYLRALTDLGILVEEDVPPSKIYRYSSRRYDDVYDMMKDVLEPYDGVKRQELAVSLMTRLFRRPVFREELRRVGVTDFSSDAVVESEDELVRPMLRLRQSLSIPQDDPALDFDKTKRRQVEPQLTEALLEALRKTMDLGELVFHQEQKKLIKPP